MSIIKFLRGSGIDRIFKRYLNVALKRGRVPTLDNTYIDEEILKHGEEVHICI